MAGEFFALASAICWSLHMIYTRKAQNKTALAPMLGIFITILVNNIINVFAMIIRHFVFDPVPLNSTGILFFIFAGVWNSFIGRSLLFTCVAMLGAAKAGLTKATVPVFALFGGVFVLGERLGPWNWLGISVVLFGLFLMSLDAAHRDRKKLSESAKLDTAERRAGQLYIIKGITFGLGAAFFLGSGNVFRKAGITEVPDTILSVSVSSLFAMLACVLFLLIQRKGKDMLYAIRNIEFNFIMSGVFASAAIYTLVNALRLIPVSIANPISATEPLFTILFVWLLKEGKKENLGFQTLIFGLIMVTGTIILITS
jgi:drug/metabolite transporter (DMT)-like permease